MQKTYDLTTIKAVPDAILKRKRDRVEYKIYILLFVSVNQYDLTKCAKQISYKRNL